MERNKTPEKGKKKKKKKNINKVASELVQKMTRVYIYILVSQHARCTWSKALLFFWIKINNYNLDIFLFFKQIKMINFRDKQ